MNITALSSLSGVIERRLLINYRVDPEAIAAVLPPPFEPTLVGGDAIAGICLIQLRVGPSWLPDRVGVRSSNGAHRIAVTLPDGSEAVYVPRRDSDSVINTLIGGRLFPGKHHRATITSEDSGSRVAVELNSYDDSTRVSVAATTTDHLPANSVFASVQEVSDFFEAGSFGYSDTGTAGRYDCLELRAKNWAVTPLAVEHVESTFFDDRSRFGVGVAELDNALLMRDIHHSWHSHRQMASTDNASRAVVRCSNR
ncbi:MAG: DUF2071 domain-containing protein [Acidimicrobiales bacterium]